MLLKSLDIHGFKSFADKTTLEFHEGVTGIVGPNGCGKSNVVDAIRWVLGETSAKALRGGEMADVIFNGTDSRRASGMAAVTLHLTDCEEALGVDYNEVAITRRVYKDGKSEYRINDTLCRLRDIHDLFLDTGIGRSAYSIMEQGKIDQLLSSKPEDRRAVFEEAAGVSKFKKEKKEALRKLDYTSANLLRVSDVMEEQERRIGTLKRQVSKARRYKDLSEDVKTLETHLAHQEFRELLAGRNHLHETLSQLDKEIGIKEEIIPKTETALTENRQRQSELEREITEANNLLSTAQAEIGNSEGQIKLNAERRDDYATRIQRNQSEINENKERVVQQQSDLKDTVKQVEQILGRIGEQQSTLTKHKDKVSDIRKERQEVEKQQKETEQQQLSIERKVASLKAKLESYRLNSVSTRERAEALKSEHTEIEKSLSIAHSSLESQAHKIATHLAQAVTLEEHKEEAERNYQHLRGDLDSAHTALRQEQSILSARSSRLEVLNNLLSSGEGLGEGTQSVLSGLDDPGLYKPLLGGTFAKILKTDDKYVNAIEAALGHQLQAIIVKDDTAAKSILEKLSDKSLGTAQLLVSPLTPNAQDEQLQAKPESALGWAIDLITLNQNKELRPVLTQLLENTLVVPDLETALMLRPTYADLRFITLDGEIVTPEGFLSGGKGTGDQTSTLRLQNEIDELKSEISKREKELEKAEKKIADLTHSRNQAREQVDRTKSAIQEHQIATNNLRSEEATHQRDKINCEQKLSNLKREQDSLAQKQKEAADTLSQLDTEFNKSQEQRTQIEQILRELTTKLDEIRTNEVRSFDALSELQTAVAVERRSYDALQRQQEPLEARIKELLDLSARRETEISAFQSKIENSHERDQELQDKIGNSQAGIKQHSLKLQGFQSKTTALREVIQLAETTLSEARRDLLRITEKRGKEDVAHTKIDLKIENLTNTLRERHQIELTEFQPKLNEFTACLSKRVDGQGTQPTSPTHNEEQSPTQEGEQIVEPSTADWALAEEISTDLRRKLDGMGPVNIDAIQEFEELEERHNFVRKQYDDLTSSKEELLNVIEKINKETTKMFSETFVAVKENFREMFKQLFGERGKADLILVDEDDPLESGIEIIAKPPGKKLQSITLLSGGERSMTAVALLFSIYLVKPSPFCVLDELDAPLDESNISRFLNMLDQFIRQSQFIIVTHNKRTMARADVLYGVTMPELGVSRPVGMVLSQAQEIVDEDEKKRNQSSAKSKTDTTQSPASNAAAQISS